MPATVDELARVGRARLAASTGLGRELRLSAGLSLREMAAVVGVSQTAIWQWENGVFLPSAAHALVYPAALERVSGRRLAP
jgi:DNA-binding XRE family transcriptional regulator